MSEKDNPTLKNAPQGAKKSAEDLMEDLMQAALKAVEKDDGETAEGETIEVSEDAFTEDKKEPEKEEASDTTKMPTAGMDGVYKSKIAELTAQYEEAKKRADDFYNKLLRMAADFDNFKKRAAAERAFIVNNANEQLFTELLPTIDNFGRAIEHIKLETADNQSLKGMEMIFNQMMEVYGRFGLKRFSAVGQKFDPNFHQAVSVSETSEAEPDTVVEEYAAGYMLHQKLLRPAMVVVAKRPA